MTTVIVSAALVIFAFFRINEWKRRAIRAEYSRDSLGHQNERQHEEIEKLKDDCAKIWGEKADLFLEVVKLREQVKAMSIR